MSAATGTAPVSMLEVASRWRAARRVYPLYAAVARQFQISEPCGELESPINRSEPEVLARVAHWFEKMDEKCHTWQLRQVLQTTHLATEEGLRALLQHHLERAAKVNERRDKLDYLMVQYFALYAPHHDHHHKISMVEVAESLTPVLGAVDIDDVPFIEDIEAIVRQLDVCACMRDLLEGKVLDDARALKTNAGDGYFEPKALLAFTRLNYLVRLGFFRLLHADLHAIRHALHELPRYGVDAVDCKAAGLSEAEPLSNVRQICHEWKKPFRAAYSAGNNFRQLVALRAAVERAHSFAMQHAEHEAARIAREAEEEMKRAAEARIAAEAAAVQEPVPEPSPIGPEAVPVEAADPVQTHEERAAAPEPMPAESPRQAEPEPIHALSIEQCLEEIVEQVVALPKKTASVTTMMLRGSKLLLSSWESAAFVSGGDEVSDALQRAVAARAVLQIAIDGKKRGEGVDKAGALGIAHAEAAQIQERVAEAKDAKNIDAAVNLAATAKRLLALIEEAEKTQ